MELDLLAFGAHPDDVELGAGGILAGHALRGYRCGIIDLTAGEMASNGTVAERREEAARAAKILGCFTRHCLGLPDAHLSLSREALYEVVAAIRRYRPRVVLAPYFQHDRHYDHSTTGELVRRAVYHSGLRRLPVRGTPYRPEKLYFFLLSVNKQPDFVVDISSVAEIKEQAIRAHQSQFQLHSSRDRVQTMVNTPSYMYYVNSRDSYYGSLVGVARGEGLVLHEKPLVTDLLKWGGG